MEQEIEFKNLNKEKSDLQKPIYLKPKFILSFLIIVLIILAGVFMLNKKTNKPDPKEVINSSIEKTLQIKSFAFAANSEIINKNELDTNFKLDKVILKLNGLVNKKDPDTPKLQSNIKINLADIGNLDLELISVGKSLSKNHNYYLKINSLPAILAMFVDTEALNISDEWINLSEINNTNYIDIPKENLEKLKNEQNDFWKKFLYESKLIEKLKIETLPEEKLLGKQNYHYGYYLSSQDLAYLVMENSEIVPEKNIKLTEEFLNSEINGEIWIDKDSLYLTKINGQITEVDISQATSETKDLISYEIELSDINKDQSIKVPEKSLEIEELLENLGLNYQGNTSSLFTTNNEDPFDYMENEDYYMETEQINPLSDNDNDDYLDDEEIKNSSNPIEN